MMAMSSCGRWPMNEQHKSLIVKNDPSQRVYWVTGIVKQVEEGLTDGNMGI